MRKLLPWFLQAVILVDFVLLLVPAARFLVIIGFVLLALILGAITIVFLRYHPLSEGASRKPVLFAATFFVAGAAFQISNLGNGAAAALLCLLSVVTTVFAAFFFLRYYQPRKFTLTLAWVLLPAVPTFIYYVISKWRPDSIGDTDLLVIVLSTLFLTFFAGWRIIHSKVDWRALVRHDQCKHCGKSFTVSSHECPHCKHPIDSLVRCQTCGLLLGSHDTQCPVCFSNPLVSQST